MARLLWAVRELVAVLSDAWHDADLANRIRAWWEIVSGAVIVT